MSILELPKIGYSVGGIDRYPRRRVIDFRASFLVPMKSHPGINNDSVMCDQVVGTSESRRHADFGALTNIVYLFSRSGRMKIVSI